MLTVMLAPVAFIASGGVLGEASSCAERSEMVACGLQVLNGAMKVKVRHSLAFDLISSSALPYCERNGPC